MNIIYHPKKTPSKYKKVSEKSFTIIELKEVVGGECVVMYLPKENAYLVYNKEDTQNQRHFYNREATELLLSNYESSKVKIYGKALLTSEI